MALVEGASPPVFEQIFRNARFAQGGNALFEGKVRGNPKPQVVWTRKGLQMKGNDKHQMMYDDMSGKVSLMIKTIGPGDEGEYTCTALNPYGEAICTVYISPEATKQVKKSRSGHKLHKSSSNKQVQMMQQQQQQQQLMQQQQFSSQQSNSVSSMQQMSVQQQSASMSFQESSSSSMMKSSQQVSSSSFSSVKQQSMMSSQQQSFQQTQAIKENEPEVIYLKHVERSAQQQRHEVEESTRFPAPTFMTPLRDLTLFEGEKVHFDAKVAPVGDPSMKVEWFCNGKSIAASSRVNTSCQFGFVSLDMLNATTSDTGEYTCVIKNESGVIQSSCRLIVQPRREIELEFQHSQSLRQVEVSQQQVVRKVIEEELPPRPEFVKPLVASSEKPEGSNIHLEAQVNPVSDHTMKIEWMKDGKAITASSRIGTLFNFGYVSLNINGLRVEDAGTYICRAVNASGEAFTTTTLKVSATVDLTASTGIAEQETYIKKVQQLEQYQASKQFTRQESTVEPTQPPEFVTSIKDQLEIREGGFAHFEARLEPMGDHTMKVEWLKDGRPVDASSRITSFFNFGYVALTIKQVAMHDSGNYVCVASNRCGRAEVKAKLTTLSRTDAEFRSKAWSSIQQLETSKTTQQMSFVQQEVTIAPKFVSQLKGTNIIIEGQRAHFECRIEPQNDPDLRVEWLHNGQQLKASSRIQTHYDFGYVAIDILDAKREDAGTYTLIATNALGSQQTTVDLKVDAHAQLVDQSTIHTKAVEETKRFEMKQEIRQEMVIQQEVTSMAKPIFRTPLQDPQPVMEGQNIHLEARLEPIGDPFMRVEWFCNGKPLTIGSRFRTYNDFGFIALDIISVNTTDAGKYVCRATNQLGSAETLAQVNVIAKSNIVTESEHESAMEQISFLETSTEHRMHHTIATEEVVVKQPPVFAKTLKSVEVVEGQNVHLEARLSPTGDPTMRVEWTVNGKPLKTGHKIRPAYDFDYVALDLLSIYPEDAGVYTCHARNAYGETETSATVKVTVAAQVVTESRSEMSQFQYLEQKTQVRQEVMEEHTTQAPVFTSSMKSVELKEGQKAHFECRIIPVSDPTLKIQWLHNGKPIKQGSRFREGLDFGFVSLDIMHVYAEDAGSYTCKATNVLGQAVNSADLIVRAKETIVRDTIHQAAIEQIQYLEQPRVTQTQEEGFTTQAPAFTCSMRDMQIVEGMPAHFEAKLVPVGDPKLRVDWLKDGRPIQASNRMSTLHDFGFVAFDLKYTRPDDTGIYSCKATNSIGEAVISANLQVLSAKDGPMGDSLHGEALQKIAYLEKKQLSINLAEEEGIQSAPVFVVPLQGKTSLIEGQNVHLECRIEPYPDSSLNVEWFRNDKPLPFGNRWRTSYDFGFAALDIIGAYSEDSGRYTLRAKNVLGSSESSLDVKISPRSGLLLDSDHSDALEKIKYLESKHQRTAEEEMSISEAPQFGHPLKDIRLDEGQPAHFETTLTPVNDATMRVQWLCNGKPVPQGHRFRTTYDFGFVALDILYAYAEDSGTYTCQAVNMIGETTTSSKLDVSAKAGLLLDTMDRDRLNQLRSLELRERPRPAEGEVQLMKPVFTTALNNAEGVPEQSRVHLECRLEPINDPNLRVEWFINGKSIKTGHRFRTTHDFGYVALDILYAYPEDTGTYMCKAVNRLGEAVNTCSVEVVGRKGLLLDSQHPEGWEKMKSMESRSAFRRLEVEEIATGPPHFVTQLVGVSTLAEGQVAHFEAQIEPINDPSLKIEFFHNGKPLKQASRIHTLCDFGYVALDIAQLVESDAGEYSCRAHNNQGETFSMITLKISGQDVLDTSSQRPEGLEKIKQLESRQARKQADEIHTFQKPMFTLPLQNVEKEENQNARFAARIIPVGDPTLKVEWFKDGKLLSKGSRINTVHDFGCVSLDITGLRSSDEGVYECRASNSLGEAVTTASCRVAAKGSLILDSQHPEGMRKITELERARTTKKQVSDDQQEFDKPVFVSPLTGTAMVAEGQQAHMECRVVPIGDSSMKFQWLKNGEALQMGSRFHVTQDFGFVTLDISSCVAEDSGMYMVKAFNLSGEASSSFAVHVGGKSGVMGEALHPDSYRKIQALEAEKSAKRQISDDGAIVQPPVFMEQLKEVGVVAEGQNISLEARIEPKNDPNLKVDWELNGKALKPGSRLKTTLDFGHVQLHLNDIRASDSGIYTCKAINLLGEAVSTTSIKVEEGSGIIPATAKETGPPKFVTAFTESYSISEGQSCHMEARLTPVDDPNMKVEWFKDGKPLPTGHRFRTFHDFGIVILDILYCFADDTGVYECRATNKLGSDSIKCTIQCSEKSGLILTPQVPGEMKQHTMERIQHLESMKMKTYSQQSVSHTVAPRFTVPITNIENMKEGENAHFEARLVPTDDPTLTVEWFWNGKALKAGSRIRTFCDFGFVILEISPVYPEDAGEYMCKAKNALGEAVTTATLKCSGKRNIIMDSQLPKGMEGAIDKIANLEGLGRFRAADNISDDIDQPPEFLSNLEDLLLGENSLAHFETRLTPINDPSMRVEWYHNGKNLSAGSRIKTINDFGFVILEVANVLTRDSGNYTCKATNRHGEASISCNVIVKNKHDIITDPQLPKSFRSGTESIQRLEENRWRREEMVEDSFEAKPPKFITAIKDVSIVEGMPAHFDCRVEPIGDGSMKIEWFHDGQPIQIGSRIHTISDFGFVVLDIDWTFKRDSGTYVCRATNRCGTAETKATLSCKSKKDINLDSQLPEGMSLDKLRELEKGKRQDRTEEVEAEITAPKFITQLKSRAVGEGEPAHFNCRVEPKHDPKLHVKWFHNDHELASGHRFRITHEFGYVALDILYTYPEDEGEYVCKAFNELGEDITKCELKCKELPAIQLENQVPKGMKKSEYLVQMEAAMKKYTQEIFLTEDDVYDAEKRQPPRFVTQIQSVTDLIEMQATKFECQLAPVGDPYMKVEWFFNGKALPYKNRFTPIFDFGYVAMNFSWVYPEDSGEYVCRASNLYGMDETRGILKTTGKPGIVYESQLPKGMASIERIREMESGWQRAPELIENEAERFKPCFVTKPEPQIVQEGDSARFCCRVTGYPKPRVMWLLNGHTVINGSKHKLIYDGMWHFDIPKCRDIDAGKVEVIARNQCGEAYSSTTLEITPRQDDYRSVLRHNVKRDYINSKEYRKPEWLTRMEEIQKRLSEQQHSAKITQELREVRIKEGLKAKFEASFAGNPKPDILWQFNGVEIISSDRVKIKVRDNKTALTIHDVTAADAGQYTVRVKNDMGSDNTRAGLTISKHGEEAPAPKPKPVEKPAEKPAPVAQPKPTFKREVKKPEPVKPAEEEKAKTWKKSTPKVVPKPEEKPAPGFEVKLKKAPAPGHDKPHHEDSVKIPQLKHVEHKVEEKHEEEGLQFHLKHVVEEKKEEVVKTEKVSEVKVKKTAKPESEPKQKKLAPKTEAPGPIEKEIPAMPIAETKPIEPVEETKPEPVVTVKEEGIAVQVGTTETDSQTKQSVVIQKQKAHAAEEKLQATEQKIQVAEQKAQVTEQKAQVVEQKAQVTEPKAPIKEQKAQVKEEKAQVTEQKVQVTEQKVQVTEQKAQVTEQTAQVTEQTSEITEQKLKVTEQKEQVVPEQKPAKPVEQKAKKEKHIVKTDSKTDVVESVKTKEEVHEEKQSEKPTQVQKEQTTEVPTKLPGVLKTSQKDKTAESTPKQIEQTPESPKEAPKSIPAKSQEEKPVKIIEEKHVETEELSKSKEKIKVKKTQQAIPKVKPELPKSEVIEIAEYEEPMKELANIGARLQQGVSVTELNAAYEANEFPALKRKKSQIAILKAVERVGESAVVQQVLAQEQPEIGTHTGSLDNAGFQALLTTLSNESHKIEEIITQVQPEDFTENVVEERFAKMIHDSQELVAAPQATEMTAEVRQQIDAELKKAGITEVRSEMVVASAQQTEMRVSSVQKSEIIGQGEPSVPAHDIKEGDIFYALATFVSETGEAMNLVEGERVYVLEWNNQDWWYVRKHLTEESGWVPAQYLKDEQTYTMYVQKKLVEKIEKLPVFDKPKEGEPTFAPKIIEGVHSVSAPDGSQVEFMCKVEGNPRPQITWFRQTAIIKPSQDFQIFYYDDNKATLVIKEVFPEDAGTFTCVAKNCVGFASSSAELGVQHPLSEHGGLEKHDRRSISRESSLADIVEGIPPTFAQRPQTKTADEGSTTELECRFVAIPEADVQWYHNKVELKESKRVSIQHQADMHMYCSIIKITDIKREDAGTYEVTARNREGEATNTLVLNVTPKAEAPNTPPIIVKPLTPTVCKVGEDVKMETVITGKPKPKLEWLHNGQPISLNNLRVLEKDNIYTLAIDNVTMSNDGEYTVKASNSSGSVQTSANLSVQEAIEFVETLEDVEIKERNTIEMQVEVTAEESKVKWYKDGEMINETDEHYEFKSKGRKHSIVIKNATVHHEGEYVASVGEQECSCELTVIELPPEFTKKIEPLTVTAGEERAIFEIELSKGDAITKWFKNGKEIEQSDRVHLKIDGKKQRLEIYNVELTDAGEFSCTIGNEKCSAPLKVEEPKVNFVAKLPATTSGTVGQDVRITVTLTSANAKAVWQKDTVSITESSKYSFEVDGASRTIIIKGASIEDIGKYTCIAENVRTETELELKGAEEKIEVNDEELEKEKVAIKGQDTTFTINFKKSYLEKPKVQWLFNSKSIVTSERIITTSTRKSATITIKQVENIDCGSYTAKISNSSSEVSVSFNLSIKDKPSPPRGPAAVEWKSDGCMELRWNVPESDGGAPITQYIVERREVGKKSWKQVGTSSQLSIEIRGLKKDSSYNFRVIAKNNVGCSSPFIIEETFTAAIGVRAVPKGVPSAPNNVQVTDVTSRSVTLQWSPPFNSGGVELIGYVIEKRLATTHKWERVVTVDTSVTLFTIENLKEKSQYYFRVSAENEIGAGETAATEKVSLQTHARPPSSPTAPLEITALGPHSIMVEWGAPESDGGAPLEGYKVAVRDAKRHMWMEVGRVTADVQKLKVQELAETHDYFIRIYAKNEVGFSEPLENEEPFKVIRPADYNEEEAEAEAKHDDTPSLSFSTTETLSSWMREANMDADIQSYTKSSILRRDEYFFRIWYYASKLFK